MAINYADKFAPLVDERFTLGSLTDALVSNAFDWVGVSTVKVYSRDLTTLNNYTASGTNRFGTPDDLGNAVQEMPLTQNKSFTYVIDMKTEQDTMGAMEAGATLAENTQNLLIPAIDAYRLAVIAAAAPASGTYTGQSHIVTAAVTKSNAYEEWLKVQEVLDNDKAPLGGRIGVVTPGYLNKIKQDENFVKRGDMATQIAINGLVGEIDGVPVIKVPSSYLPANVDFLITNPLATVAPMKLQLFRILTEVQGIAGAVVEALVRHDAFVLNKKKDAIGVHTSSGTPSPSVTLGKSSTSIAENATETLTATTVPAGAEITWSSSSTANATVNSNGTVTGVAAGSATITAAITVGGATYTDTCAVTVTS